MEIVYSIIVLHQNMPDLLQRSLDSIPERDDVQVIVVDDISDPAVVDFDHFPGMDRKDVEIVFDKQGRGLGNVRNVGLDHAKGKWVLFCDSDDFFAEDFPAILDEMADAEEDLIFLSFILVPSLLVQGDVPVPDEEIGGNNRIDQKVICGCCSN